ncbi:hypothetical protein ACTL6U_13125 [Rhodovibrionaceae bacterium A322]
MTQTAGPSPAPHDQVGGDQRHQPASCRAFSGPRDPILVWGAEALIDPLHLCLPDWQSQVISLSQQNTPSPGTVANSIAVDPLAAAVSPSGQPGHRVICDLLPNGHFDCGDPLEAANALAGALTGSYIRQDSTLLQIHAAAATFQLGQTSGQQPGPAEGQLLFLGDTQAGKSSLALQLARRNKRLFGDDRLAICLDQTPLQALSLGVGPKIRLPLPPDMETAQIDFLKTHQVAEREAVAHLNLPPSLMAPLGERSPLLGLVLLNRLDTPASQPASDCSLEPLDKATLLRHLLPKCLAPALSAQALVVACQNLVSQVSSWQLTYSNSSLAADYLIAQFES